MATFHDGPAEGVRLQLRRAPILLRVVYDATDFGWDALDQEEDKVKISEKVYLYYMRGPYIQVHVCNRIERHKAGVFQEGDYYLLPAELFGWTADILRVNEKYWLWCEERKVQIMEWIAEQTKKPETQET